MSANVNQVKSVVAVQGVGGLGNLGVYYGNQVLASTKDLLSTSGWRELLPDFTGPQTRLIAIKVLRVPGNPLIKGTYRLDGAKLTPIATPADGPQPF